MNAKIDTFVKLALIFFISLLSFAIGTFVGKKYSDSQYKMASLERGGHKATGDQTASFGDHGATQEGDGPGTGHDQREVASIPKAAHGTAKGHGDSEIMNDEEITKLAEEMGVNQGTTNHAIPMHGTGKAPQGHGEAKKDNPKTDKNHLNPHRDGQFSKTKSPDKAKAVSHERPLDVATKLTGDAKEANSRDRREPTSLHPNLGQYEQGKFTVQIASFANKGEAEARVYGLKEKGFEAFFIPAQVKGRTWYRVNVGLFATESEAKSYRKGFLDKTKTDAAIVQKISE